MSLIYGYSDETQEEIEKLNTDKLSINGGTMKSDLNMRLWSIRGNPDPIFDDQLIRKKYTDDKFVTITNFRKQLSETLMGVF